MTVQQSNLLFVGAVVVIVVLTGGLGVALAFGIALFDRQLRPLVPTSAGRRVEAAGKGALSPAPKTSAAPARRPIAGLGLVVFALAILAAGLLAGRFARLMPVEASSEASQVDLLFNAMLGIGVAIFLLVEGLLVYFALRFRRKPGDESDGLPVHGSNRLEAAWTIVPAVIVTWLAVYSYQILVQIQAPRPEAMVVEVTARQFEWQFHYPDSGVTSHDLYVPEDRAIRLKINSEDVIHSFWVPAFRIKQDAIPLRETNTYFTATDTGTYPVVCAELCGAGHARMGLTSHVTVQSPAEFDAWIARQKAAAPADPRVMLFTTTYGCGGCHSLAAAGAAGKIGPDLDGIGTAAAVREAGLSADAYIRQSIVDPNAFIAPQCPAGPCPKPSLMPPDFGTRMPESDLNALVSYLLEQK